MFFLLGSVGASALDYLASKVSQPVSRNGVGGGGASTTLASSNPGASASNASQSPAAATAPSPGWTPLSPSVLGFLIQNQSAFSTGSAAASQIGSSAAGSGGSPNGLRAQVSQLEAAVNAGNLAGARAAYSGLSQSAGVQNAAGTPFAQGLGQIGQALTAGNVSQAQQTVRSLEPQMSGAAEGMHPHHHGTRRATDASTPGENPAASSPGDSTSAAVGTTSVTTNGDGSTTTTITYGDGSTATTTTPATINASRGSVGNVSSSFGVAPPAMTNNVLGTLIQMQAQHLTQTATEQLTIVR
jgi:hypothetical protein